MEILQVKLLTFAVLITQVKGVSKFIQSHYEWRENLYFNLSQTIVQITKKTSCCICTHLPSHSASSISVLGIPIPNNI